MRQKNREELSMGFIADMYGKQPPDFVKGFLAALDIYAVWRDGERFIGSPERPLKEVMCDAVNQLAENPEYFKEEIEKLF